MSTVPVPQPANTDAIIGENINMLMFRARMRQTQLAFTLGMTQGALSRKLRGDRPWYADEILAAATAFRVPVGALFVELPDLDSNQEPIGSQSHEVAYMNDFIQKKNAVHTNQDGNGEVG